MKRMLMLAKVQAWVFVLLLFPLYLQAQARVEMDSVASVSGPMVFIKVATSLVIIVGFIFLCAWFARRAGLVRFTATNNFKVIASLPLGNREKMLLVQVGKSYLLLGVTGQQITLLKNYAEGENPLEKTVESEEENQADSFAHQLKKILSQGLPK